MLNRSDAWTLLDNHNKLLSSFKLRDHKLRQLFDSSNALVAQFLVVEQAVKLLTENNIYNFKKYHHLLDEYKDVAGIKEIVSDEPAVLINNFLLRYPEAKLARLFARENEIVNETILSFYQQLRDVIAIKPLLIFKSKEREELVVQFPAEAMRRKFFAKLDGDPSAAPYMYLELAHQDRIFFPVKTDAGKGLSIAFPSVSAMKQFVNLLALDKQTDMQIAMDKSASRLSFNDRRLFESVVSLPLPVHLYAKANNTGGYSHHLFDKPDRQGSQPVIRQDVTPRLTR